MVIALMAIMLC